VQAPDHQESTMPRSTRHHSAFFKCKVAVEALKGDKTLTQIASQYSINATVVSSWKSFAMEYIKESFNKLIGNLQDKNIKLTDLL
jgi:transposase-like protein